MEMFCFQCQETAKNKGCTIRGVCGKEPDVAALQDLVIWLLKGLSFLAVESRAQGVTRSEADELIAEALFTTITNANFDAQRFVALVHRAIEERDSLRASLPGPVRNAPPECAVWRPERGDADELIAKGKAVGVMADASLDEDRRSLQQLLTYGLKGMAAYIHHAYMLGYRKDELLQYLEDGLLATLNESLSVSDLVGEVLRCGEMGVLAMAFLDQANTGRFGDPEPTQVNIGVRPGPGILVSGHDLRDLEELLIQTEGKGVNVYTHGEMLPANSYPALKKYPHLIGNYGRSWWRQQDEFEKFGGAILMTTNCIVKPRDSYKDRIFTTGAAGWPGVQHIADRVVGQQKDFAPVIAKALASPEPEPLEQGTIPGGFAHTAILSVADQVVAAIKSGAIKRFVVMAGCDGRHKEREYFTEVAKALPEDSVILTAGCAKYRYNKLNLGEIGGIPRILDAGQCNDSYSLVVIALKLAEVFGVKSVNDLPIAYDIGWYEQKAVIVLLALLSLGVKDIRLGPTLPAFLSPNVVKVLVDKFSLQPITTVEEDVAAIVAA